jgi:hypothetical protein
LRFINRSMSGGEESGEESGSRFLRKKVIIPVVLAVIIGVAGYYEISLYEQGVVQTSVVTGKITQVQLPTSGPGAGAAKEIGNPGAIGVAAAGGGNYGLTYVTISVPSGSFTQTFSCSVLAYSVGQTVKVADQLLRSGQHVYSPDVACRGTVSAFQSLHITNTTSSSG